MSRKLKRLLFFGAFAPLVACGGNGKLAPPKLEDEFSAARKQMVERQLASRGIGIKDDRVLKVMGEVPRHQFVPADVRALAYRDRPLPIGYGQTISQPFIVAFMTEALNPKPTDRVLEIGTGSGYQAAVLSKLVHEVYSIEIVKPLGETATKVLKKEGFNNVHVKVGDGYKGWPGKDPFDAIIVTCAPENVPEPLVEQLKDGGRMVIPVGERAGRQELYILEKQDGEVTRKAVLPVRFVPMTGINEDTE